MFDLCNNYSKCNVKITKKIKGVADWLLLLLFQNSTTYAHN